MNPDSAETPSDQPSSCDPRNALIEAMLGEHARLGTDDDRALLAAIASKTVDRPVATRVVELVPEASQPMPRERFPSREWMKVAAVVTLSLSAIGLFLSQRNAPAVGRTEQTFQLVSRPLMMTATAVAPENDLNVDARPPLPAAPALGEWPPTGLNSPAFDALPPSGDSPQLALADTVSEELFAEFSISAERIFPGTGDGLVYEGDVVLEHPEFTLKADRLEMAHVSDDDKVGSFIAQGENLEIEKHSSAGEIEVARADTATWDANGGRIILAGGPPTLSAGNSFVSPQSSNGFIILQSGGYQVIER